MAKYNVVELKIEDGKLIGLSSKKNIEQKVFENRNVIYIYHGSISKKIYIGQTKHFLYRHKQHFSGKEKKFNDSDFDEVLVVFSQYFNRSALDDVESQLITYFMADNSKSPKKNIGFEKSEIINKTGGNSVNGYENREDVSSKDVLPLWENELYKKGWVYSKTINELKSSVLVKYSPIKYLTNEQTELIREILDNPNKNYVINGDAGTGKTVLLTHLVANMLINKKAESIAVIVQPNWEKTAIDIFKTYGMNDDRISVLTSTKFIQKQNKYDVIIVDESHKLSRRYGKQHPSFNLVYNIDEFKECQSHLEIIQKLSSQVILMYDVLQAIRPANITRDMFQSLTKDYEKRFLKTQFRICTPNNKKYTSNDYINGIKYLLYKDTGLLDSELCSFDFNFNRELFKEKQQDSYFGYFTEKPLHNLIDWIDEDKNYNPEHINRILAGLVEPWKQSDGKDETIKQWYEGDISRRWNSAQENWIQCKDKDAEEQIGSVFAVQGLDLNKVGVLIGSDLQVDDNGKLYAEPKNFYNINGTFTSEEMEIQENKDEFTLFVMNIYYVLLTRGIDGIRIGFWKNESFLEYMKKTLEIV